MIIIRPLRQGDRVSIAHLSGELGYDSSQEQILERLAHIAGNIHHQIYVACDNNLVIGWIHAHRVCLLASSGYIEIGGLIVSKDYRRQGIGTRLLQTVEEWAKQEGVTRVRLRSGMQRKEEAHPFYDAQGYQRLGESVGFEKYIPKE